MRFLGYDFGAEDDPTPTGIAPEAAVLPLLSGTVIHAAHARLLAGQPLELVMRETIDGYRHEIVKAGLFGIAVTTDLINEQAALLEGMLRTWAITRMPRILEEYEVVSIEEKWDWELAPGLVERIRMDVIVRRRDDGLLHIWDFKTLNYPSEMWMEKFEHDHQTLLYVEALKERMNEPVGGIIYEGLVKGLFRKETAFRSKWFGLKVQHSPYTFAYALRGDGLSVYQTEYTSKKGYEKVRPYDEMPMKDWVEDWLIPEGKTNELFIVLPVIDPPAYELLRMKEQVIREELAYKDLVQRWRAMPDGPDRDKFLDVAAPMRVSRCFKFGQDNRCAFTWICFNQGAQPLDGGGYVKRVPHHDTDLEIAA